MTVIKVEGKSYVLSIMTVGKRKINETGVLIFELLFAGNGSITYVVQDTNKTKVQAMQRAVNYIEIKLTQDVPEIDLTPVFKTLDNLGFDKVDSIYDNFNPNGVVEIDLKKQSKRHVEGIFIKHTFDELVSYHKIAASAFSVSAWGLSVSDSATLRLYVRGAISKVYPTIEYMFNVAMPYVEDEKHRTDGRRAECKEVIEKLSEQSAVVDLNVVDYILRQSMRKSNIERVITLTTFN